ASDWMLIGDKRDLSRVPATERAAAAAYRQAGIGPHDVDVVELHDCFTIAEIVATEGLGLFEPGAGGLAAEKGWTSLGGQIPVNPSGGLKAKGHPIGATGAAQICEVVTQLRGEAGPRQVQGALTGIRCVGGGALAVPPKELCPECGARRWEPVPLSGEGTIASYTVIRVAPRGHAGDAPYAIAAVRLREGVSLLGRVVDVPLAALAAGLPVRFRPM